MTGNAEGASAVGVPASIPSEEVTPRDRRYAEEPSIELVVGRIGRAHGLRGDVAIDVRTDEPERRFTDGAAFDTSHGKLELRSSRWHGQRLLATFVGVTDRNAAEGLNGIELRVGVPATERPDDPEEFYDHQLIGLVAVTEEGTHVGEVREILHLPAQDVLVVRRDGAELLIPFVSEIVPALDLEARRLVVVPPPGLLDGE